jgi:hypothetical protein
LSISIQGGGIEDLGKLGHSPLLCLQLAILFICATLWNVPSQFRYAPKGNPEPQIGPDQGRFNLPGKNKVQKKASDTD